MSDDTATPPSSPLPQPVMGSSGSHEQWRPPHESQPPQTNTPPTAPAPTASSGSSRLMMVVAGSLVLVVVLLLGVIVLLATGNRRGGAAEMDSAASAATARLAALQEEVHDLERQVDDATRSNRTLTDQRDRAEREARVLYQQLTELVASGKTSSRVVPPRRTYAVASPTAWLFAGLFGQLSYTPPATPLPAATHSSLPPAIQGDAERVHLVARRDQLQAELRRLLDQESSLRREAEELQSATLTLRSQLDQLRGFATCDVIFLQPGILAVGLRDDDGGGFLVAASGKGTMAQYARQIAHRAGIYVVDDSQALAGRLANVEGRVPADLASQAREYWKVREYVPEDAESMVTFHDLNAGEHRIGLLLSQDSGGLSVATIRDRGERVDRGRIEVGTALRGADNNLLDRSPTVDYLDYALLQVAQKLSSYDKPTAHRLALRVKTDLSQSRLERLAGYRPARYMNPWLKFLMEGRALAVDTVDGAFEKDRGMEALRNELEDRLHEKLHMLGIPVLERENTGELLFEQQIAGDVAPDRRRRTRLTVETREPLPWRRGPRIERRTTETSFGPTVAEVDAKLDIARTLNQPIPLDDPGTLSFATHVLVVELGDAVAEGSLRFAVRLLNARSSDILWAGTSERPFYNPALATDHMLDSGKLMAINATKSRRRVDSDPLYNPVTKKPDSCVVYFEGLAANKMIFRDLFGYSMQLVSPDNIVKEDCRYIRTLDDVPEDNRLRHLVWSVMREVRPPAGRVKAVVAGGGQGQGLVEVSCANAAERFRTSTKLAASRPEKGYNDATGEHYLQPLPVELVVRDASRNGFTATYDRTGRDAVWSEEVKLQQGDVIYSRGEVQPLVAITPPTLERPTQQDWDKLQLDAPLKFDQFVQWSSGGARELARKMTAAFDRVHTPYVELSDPAVAPRIGATHVVEGRIRPTQGKAFMIYLRVFKTGQTDPLTTIRAKIGRDQLMNWTP